ncbi:zona pellucida sperm-binding protein 3-like [Sinocyclocheilus grahami]|uniref:Zona pellucida sperm-binding protein 3 n=1 Tax=Sinocyclocheilus grahami TaxID=75366 RepID=A0A672T853_SINGR|nr:PREDICTED: zona pellucida sperm-binding protein 3-like [Sinocyclocheilus grahami]
MRTMTESLILPLLILILTEFSDVRASPLSSDPHIPHPSGRSQMREPFQIKQPSNQMKESPGRKITRVKTVAVICHEHYMEIAIKADLFDVGLPVDASELRLGADSQFIPSCKVSAFSTNEYAIAAELTDCGTQHWITDDSLIYTNLLIFTPQPSPDGVVRLEQAVVPIECYYSRRFDVTSNPIRPTWVPYSSTQSAVEDLQFSLKLMTSDWRSERASSVYFLGDIINIEASVHLGHHVNLSVYFESCVATVTPDIMSVPRYTFIENHGCLMDGQTTGSKSRFLPRIQNDKLKLQLDAFKFHQEAKPEMYITCTLQAYPVMDVVNPFHKACSFIDGSWKAADGGDWACYSCQATKDYAPSFRSTLQQSEPPSPRQDQTSSSQRPNKFQASIQEGSGSSFKSLRTASEPVFSWRNIILPQEEDEGIVSVGWEQEKTVGPLAILPKKIKMGFLAPPRVKQGVPPVPSLSKDKKPIPHSSLWKNGISAEMDQEGALTPQPSLEATEQANIMEIKLEEEDEYDSDDKEDYDGGHSQNHDYEEEKGKAKEVNQSMWKTRLLPEEDFKELFTTRASNSEEDFGLHTLGPSPSLPDEEEGTYHPSKDT